MREDFEALRYVSVCVEREWTDAQDIYAKRNQVFLLI